MSEDRQAPALADLPDEVRHRVHVLTAEVLPAVAKLPPPLRKVADFAPARRARLGAGAMTAALDADDDFRDRVAVQVTGALPQPAEDLMDLTPEGSPVTRAALAWLLRPGGWQEVLDAALASLAKRAVEEDDGETDRLRAQAEAADQAVRDLRARHRDEVADLKGENTALRRKLGEARSALRQARAQVDDAGAAADELRGRAEAATAAAEKELRRLRSQVARLEDEARAERRAGRTEREETSLRARLLLDAVIDAANGLRRELALPPSSGTPGERLEASLASEGTREPSSAGSLGPASTALLEQYLALPRARLIVDGYNVSKTAWPESSLEAQRTRLLQGLAAVVARTRVEATVVFDAAMSASRPVVATPRGVKVVFSPQGVIADRVISELVAVEPRGRVVIVVSSDQEVARDAGVAGARSVTAEALVGLLGRN